MFLMSDYLLSILIACLVLLIAIIIKRRLDYFSGRGIHYLKPSWRILLVLLNPSKVTEFQFEMYDKVKKSGETFIGYLDLFLNPNIFVVEPAMVQNVFIKDFSHFHDHGIEVDSEMDPLNGHLFNMKGDQWRALRNKLLPTFTSGKLKGMIPAIEQCAHSLIKDMKHDKSLSQEVNLKDLYKRFTLATIASCAFGIEPSSVKDPDCEFQKILRKALTSSALTQMKLILMISWPKISKLLKLKFVAQEVDDFFLKLTKDTMEMRKKSGVKRNDFIQLLLELKEKGSVQVDHRDLEKDEEDLMKQQKLAESETTSKLEMTHELLTAQVFVFIGAGFDNTAYLLSITNYLLSTNKDVQQRVRKEVRAAKSKHGGINYESLKDMKLLGACIDEALRLYPPLSFLFRGCTKNYTLSTGATVEKGTMMFIPIKSLQNDSTYWRNPEKFIPDRFLTDDITPGTYMPFGDGPRICIAQRLVLLMGKIMLAELIDSCELLPSKKTQEPIKQTFLLTAEIKGGLWGSFQPLNE